MVFYCTILARAFLFICKIINKGNVMSTNETIQSNLQHEISTALSFWQLSLDAVESLTKLNIKLSKNILEYQTRAIKELSEISNPSEAFPIVNKLATETIDKAMKHSNETFAVISDSQAHLAKVANSQNFN